MTHHISWKNIPLRVPQTYIYWIGPSRSELGKLRRRCDECIATTDKWKRKTQLLQKICRNLNMVMRKYISDVIGGKELPVPVKIVRSVGLQVTKVNVARIVAYFKILFLSCFQQKLPKLTRLHVNQLWRADKMEKYCFFRSFSYVFSWFQMWNHWKRCKMTKKGSKIISTSSRVRAAPKSWSTYTICNHLKTDSFTSGLHMLKVLSFLPCWWECQIGT